MVKTVSQLMLVKIYWCFCLTFMSENSVQVMHTYVALRRILVRLRRDRDKKIDAEIELTSVSISGLE